MQTNVNREKTVAQPRLPNWLRRPVQNNPNVQKVRNLINDQHLHTVCQSAGCPNLTECFGRSTATFLILGKTCTRRCRFCGVQKGHPENPDLDEPDRVAQAASALALKHVVVTSVTRDDLPDGGAAVFAKTVCSLSEALPNASIEVLIPDFQGDLDALKTVLHSGVDVLNHNVETVPRLYPDVRPQADFHQSLSLLAHAKKIRPDVFTKTGIMVGLGETTSEIFDLFDWLAGIHIDALTIGQYLSPNHSSFPVQEFVRPETFSIYESEAKIRGIPWVQAGPFVRSSYHADELLEAKQGVISE